MVLEVNQFCVCFMFLSVVAVVFVRLYGVHGTWPYDQDGGSRRRQATGPTGQGGSGESRGEVIVSGGLQ